MNEEIVTCKYCQENIQIGRGIYLENDFTLGQMGWFHYGPCKWHQEEIWNVPKKKESETEMTNQTAVKSSFEYQGQTWTSFWNGKEYGGTKYITVSRPGGSEVKITASFSRGLSAGGSRSLDFAKLAYKSVTGEDW